jgi:hypothetical protein
MIEGGCFCKRIRYTIEEGAYRSVNCHCTMCRHIHAAAYVTWIVVSVGRFRYTTEAPAKLASSEGGARDYCPACGTHVACVNTHHAGVVDVAVGGLDSPESFKPTLDVFTDTRLPWVQLHEQG